MSADSRLTPCTRAAPYVGHASDVTDEMITGFIQDIVAAGYISTASSVVSLVLHLIKTPDVQEQIFAEVDKVIGQSSPVFDHRRSMPYTEASILEVRIVIFLPFCKYLQKDFIFIL